MIKLYLDEDVPEAIAVALRLRGYDVMTVSEVGRKGLTDIEQIKYATSENRIMFTHNIADFCKIHSEFIKRGNEHSGIILSKQVSVGIIIKALLRLLSNLTNEKVRNNVIWLSEWVT
jgi:predicted nuclease of predicted toxin-antitoxin system